MRKFDPYNFDYKSYIKEQHDLLREMPAKMDDREWRLNDFIRNNHEGLRIEENEKMIGFFGEGENKKRLFHTKENNIEFYSLLDEKTPFINAEYSFEQITHPVRGIINRDIWNHPHCKGLVWYFFGKFIIPKESTIISDNIQTDKGFNFWKNIFTEYVGSKKSHKLLILDFKSGKIVEELINKDEMDEYSGDNKHNLRFVLQKI